MRPSDREEMIGGTQGLRVVDFWHWAYSDLLSNANRGVFAEFLVSAALGQLECPREEWDAADVKYSDHWVEVKCSAYIQSWEQKGPSVISFDIAKKRSWRAETNAYDSEPGRPAAVYVFCLFAEMDEAKADVLDLSQWRFFVLSTVKLEQAFGDQKTVRLAPLQTITGECLYADLKQSIDDALRQKDHQD